MRCFSPVYRSICLLIQQAVCFAAVLIAEAVNRSRDTTAAADKFSSTIIIKRHHGGSSQKPAKLYSITYHFPAPNNSYRCRLIVNNTYCCLIGNNGRYGFCRGVSGDGNQPDGQTRVVLLTSRWSRTFINCPDHPASSLTGISAISPHIGGCHGTALLHCIIEES